MFNPKHWFAVTVTLCFTLSTGLAFAAQSTGNVTAVPAGQQLEFDLFLPLQNEKALDQLLVELKDPNSANYHHWLTPQEFKSRFGPNPESLGRVVGHLQRNGLSIVREHTQGVRVRGEAAAVMSALGLSLQMKKVNGKDRLVSAPGQTMRAELGNEGAMISAFAPVGERHVHSKKMSAVPANRYAAFGTYWFTDLKQAYDFPAYPSLTGKGATVAIVMASDYLDSDVTNFFNHEKFTAISGQPTPTIVRKPVSGGAPFDPNSGASLEVSLDIQQVGGMAPDAVIELYNIPDLSDNSIMAAYTQIVSDNTADIVSSSFGGAEDLYTAYYNGGTDYTWMLAAYEQIFKQGNAQGITFVASSGDSGGLAVPSLDYFYGSTTATFVAGVEHPAVSPSVTGVGGTNLKTITGQGLNSAYVSENAYGDPEVPYDPYALGANVSGGYWGSGGGVSKVFAKPAYQMLVPTGSRTMRTVPDVSVMEGGCPGLAVSPCSADRSAAVVAFDGGYYGVIGTSVSAPDFAGILALAVQHAGGHRLGNINYLLYLQAFLQAQQIGAPVFHTGIHGFNGAEYTKPVYNQVTGLGTPYVRRLILAPQQPAAGNPQTPSNP